MSKLREQELADLRQQVEAPTRAQQRLREIETEMAQEKENEARAAAEKRAVAISRALGSVASELEDDERRALEAAQAYVTAVARLNDRFRQKYEALLLENEALKDRFGIKGAKLPAGVLSPERHATSIEAFRTVNAVVYVGESWFRITAHTEKCEHGIRIRRTYGEVAGTPTLDIIKDAGLKPFPALTDAQRERLEERKRENAQVAKDLAAYATEVERVTAGERIFR